MLAAPRVGHGNRGFTMVELMVTLSVLSILTALAMPSFNTMMAENRVRGKAYELAAALKTAQTEALRRSREVVFVLTDSALPTSSLSGSNTGKGWASVALPISGSPSTVKPEVVYVGGYKDGTADVKVAADVPAICFLPDGSIKDDQATGITNANCTIASGASSINFSLAPSSGTKAWRVSVSIRGQITTCLGTANSSGVVTCS